LQDEKQVALSISRWSLEPDVVSKDASERICEWKDSVTLALAANAKAPLAPDHIIEMKLEDFSRAQSTQEHQVHDGAVSVTFETAEEGANLIWPEWLNQ